jgi:hypothetical protein
LRGLRGSEVHWIHCHGTCMRACPTGPGNRQKVRAGTWRASRRKLALWRGGTRHSGTVHRGRRGTLVFAWRAGLVKVQAEQSWLVFGLCHGPGWRWRWRCENPCSCTAELFDAPSNQSRPREWVPLLSFPSRPPCIVRGETFSFPLLLISSLPSSSRHVFCTCWDLSDVLLIPWGARCHLSPFDGDTK